MTAIVHEPDGAGRGRRLPRHMTDETPSILIWIDLEMTGLDPAQEVILEAVALLRMLT